MRRRLDCDYNLLDTCAHPEGGDTIILQNEEPKPAVTIQKPNLHCSDLGDRHAYCSFGASSVRQNVFEWRYATIHADMNPTARIRDPSLFRPHPDVRDAVKPGRQPWARSGSGNKALVELQSSRRGLWAGLLHCPRRIYGYLAPGSPQHVLTARNGFIGNCT